MVTDRGPTVLGLDGINALHYNVAFMMSSKHHPLPSKVKTLIHKCANNRGGMKIDPVHLQPTCDPIFKKARSVPYGLRIPVQENINELVQKGILRPVASSSWATPIVTPLKSDGRPRICGDYRVTLNPYLKQTANTTLEVEDMFNGLAGSKIFSKVDLTNAFLQVPLDDSSKELTTIHTVWGLYQYEFLPFGLTISPGIFQKVIDSVITDLPGTRSYQDDIIVFATSPEEHDKRLQRLLQVLDDKNIQINAKKSVFQVSSLEYLGYRIDGAGIHPNLDRIRAVQQAPKPSNPKQLQSFLGFAQYYSRFVKNFAAKAQPLFDMLAAATFAWSPDTDKAYELLLDSIVNGEVLRSFQVGVPCHLYVDASEKALGAVLEQEGHPVLCISKSLSTAERNYAQTQREALAIIWAVRRLHKFLYGKQFHIYTDHKALEHIFNPTASVGKATSAMLQRWAIDLSAYDYTIRHRPGKQLPHADYLSRHACSDPPSNFCYFVNPLPIDRNTLINETKKVYGSVITGLRNGWSPTARKRFPELYSKRTELSIQADGILLYNEQVLIPPTCREALLHHLHIGHLGRDKMKSLARMLCWWPNINSDIISFCKQCQKCLTKPKTHRNWTPWPVTFKAMQRVHIDFCGPFIGKYYALVVEDSYSKYPEVFLTTNATAEFTKWALRRFFAREGVPQILVSDNGTQFTSEILQTWLKKIGCHSVFTAPRHPQSNGLAENFVKTLKMAIRTQAPENVSELWQAVDSFLIQYRNATHTTTGTTPSMLLHGRNARTTANMDTTDITFFRGNDNRLCRGLILNHIGNRMCNILDSSDGTLHRRHVDQISINMSPTSSTTSPAPSPPTSPRANSIAPPLTTPPTVPQHVSVPPALTGTSPLPPRPVPDSELPNLSSPSRSVRLLQHTQQVSPPNPLRRSSRLRTKPSWYPN